MPHLISGAPTSMDLTHFGGCPTNTFPIIPNDSQSRLTHLSKAEYIHQGLRWNCKWCTTESVCVPCLWVMPPTYVHIDISYLEQLYQCLLDFYIGCGPLHRLTNVLDIRMDSIGTLEAKPAYIHIWAPDRPLSTYIRRGRLVCDNRQRWSIRGKSGWRSKVI